MTKSYEWKILDANVMLASERDMALLSHTGELPEDWAGVPRYQETEYGYVLWLKDELYDEEQLEHLGFSRPFIQTINWAVRNGFRMVNLEEGGAEPVWLEEPQ